MPEADSEPTNTDVPGPAVMPSGAHPFGRLICEGPGAAAKPGAANATARKAAASKARAERRAGERERDPTWGRGVIGLSSLSSGQSRLGEVPATPSSASGPGPSEGTTDRPKAVLASEPHQTALIHTDCGL